MTESGRADEQLQVIARFEVRHRSYLAPDGSIHRRLPAFASDTRLLVRLYRAMVLVRAFDRVGSSDQVPRSVCVTLLRAGRANGSGNFSSSFSECFSTLSTKTGHSPVEGYRTSRT